jgi:hypothetical protein
MVLRYTIGRALAGKVCAADEAFGDLERQISRFAIGPAWNWFVERASSLESELDAVGGFDERIADQLDVVGTAMLAADDWDRYEQADYLCWQLDEASTAFIVTLQPRLNGLRVAANAVYGRAKLEDSLPIVAPQRLELFPRQLALVWNVANYVKHRDEWGANLTEQQRRAFDALLDLGVATGTQTDRELARFPSIGALCAISDRSSLREAIAVTLELCLAHAREMAARIQSDFEPFAAALEAARVAKRRALLESMKQD